MYPERQYVQPSEQPLWERLQMTSRMPTALLLFGQSTCHPGSVFHAVQLLINFQYRALPRHHRCQPRFVTVHVQVLH
jgi:hypothetical protein